MGGSSWFYECAYEDDPQAALDALRLRTFESGDFERSWDFARGLLVMDVEEIGEASGQPMAPDSLERLRSGAQPTSIDEALSWAMESGTHSILDVDEVVDVVGDGDLGTVMPLSAERYPELFATVTPTPEQVRAVGHELADESPQRWTGVVVTAFTDGAPSHLFFAGSSGD